MHGEIKLLGVKISTQSKNEVLLKIKKILNSDRKHYIATPNPEFLLTAEQDDKFKEILNQSEINIPDGTSGEYELVIEAESKGVSVRDKTTVLITGQGVTGFAGFLDMSESNRKYFSIAILVAVAGLFGFFIVRRIVRSMGKGSSKKH